MKNAVQLIAYVDRLAGGNLRDLHALLRGPLGGLFGGVHLLPFYYPVDGADAGFDPIDHLRVDPRLGDWNDIAAIARDVDVMADVIVNHASSRSPQFLDFKARGTASRYAGMFLTREKVFPQGITPQQQALIYRPRPGSPFTPVRLADGSEPLVWTTFTPEQIDIDVEHPEGRAYLMDILHQLAGAGVGMIRLDAVGYAIKRAGTSCFMLPQTFAFIGEFAAHARAAGLEVLVEVHAHHQRQIEIARSVDWVYDFALPPLVLHTLFSGDASALKRWLAIRPTNTLTVLDTHDGIGIIDIGAEGAAAGLVEPDELDRLVERIHVNSGGDSRAATGAAASNLDLYQVNCTYYAALGCDDRAYLIARAIQFFVPGVPQVYYVGLLAGGNDMALLGRTGVGRDINRHRYSRDEIDTQLDAPVVRSLLQLIRLRNEHPAFQGRFELLPGPPAELALRWTHGDAHALLHVDLAAGEARLEVSGPAPDPSLLAALRAPHR